MTHNIIITRQIAQSGLALLDQHHYRLTVSRKHRLLTRAELKRLVAGSDALISLLTDQIDESVIVAAGPQLKIIANYAVGVDNIDLKAAKKHRVLVTNTPGVLDNAVAEHTVALLLAAARRLAEADQFVRTGQYTGWDPELFLGSELSGKTLGIIGLGRIGSRVGEIAARGLGMKLLYTDPKHQPKFEAATGAKFCDIETLIKQSDSVTLHVPLLPTTRHLINWQRLRQMKPTAVLINTSRGPVIEESALIRALKEKEIFAAAIDVFEHEPEISRELRKLENTILTPHIASATVEAREAMSLLAAKNVIAALEGKTPPNLVS